MKYNPDKHHRKSIRLKGYDYSQAGAYFITMCVQDRACLFGRIDGNICEPYEAGAMVEKWYNEMNIKYSGVKPCEYIIMPNHLHAIIVIMDDFIVGADLRVCLITDTPPKQGGHTGPPLQTIIQWFKTMTTNEYIRGVKNHGWPPFRNKLWQRNYYERIIRNDDEYQRIADYIVNNPSTWKDDRLWTE